MHNFTRAADAVETAVQVGVGDVARTTGHARHGGARAAGARRRRPARRRQGVPQDRAAGTAQDTHHGAPRTGDVQPGTASRHIGRPS